MELGLAIKRAQGDAMTANIYASSNPPLLFAYTHAAAEVNRLVYAMDTLPWRHSHFRAHKSSPAQSCGGPAAESPATPLVCLGGGTPHKPPVLRNSGHVLHEGTELADFLRTQVGNALEAHVHLSFGDHTVASDGRRACHVALFSAARLFSLVATGLLSPPIGTAAAWL